MTSVYMVRFLLIRVVCVSANMLIVRSKRGIVKKILFIVVEVLKDFEDVSMANILKYLFHASVGRAQA